MHEKDIYLSALMESIFKNVEYFVSAILVYKGDNATKVILDASVLKLSRPNHPNNCRELDLLKLGIRNVRQVKFWFNRGAVLKIDMEDRALALPRAKKVNNFNVIGPTISINNIERHVYKYYFVGLHQDVFLEKDPANECANYPTREYNSYENCDSKFVIRFLEENFSKGFFPIWVTDAEENVTKWMNLTAKLSDQPLSDAYNGILSGRTMSDCTMPCIQTKMKTAFTEHKFVDRNYSKIDITFEKLVPVHKSQFSVFNLAQFLSALGGTMGIWLGVGILQSLQIAIKFIFRNRI